MHTLVLDLAIHASSKLSRQALQFCWLKLNRDMTDPLSLSAPPPALLPPPPLLPSPLPHRQLSREPLCCEAGLISISIRLR